MAKTETTTKTKTTNRQANGEPRITDHEFEMAKLANNARAMDVMHNVSTRRLDFLRSIVDPRRDVYDECGLPRTEDMTPELYREFYDREAIATRVVEVMPAESWLVTPTVLETEATESDDETEFEKALTEVGNGLRGDSKFQDDEGSPLWEYLQRIDMLSGVGSFGVLLLGVDDGAELNKELVPRKGAKLMFLRAFDESLAAISSSEGDPKNPRFGQPTSYQLTFNDPRSTHIRQHIRGDSSFTKAVHWTRVIHVADNLGSSEWFGVPRQRPVWNNLHAIQKVLLGSGEMYWKAAFMGLAFSSHPQLGTDVQVDTSGMRDMVERYENGLQRYITALGFEVNSLAPQVSDPTGHIDAQINAICIKTGIPKRVFTGSELGELASSEDTKRWNGRLKGRRNNYLTPRVIVPFIDRLIDMRILPEPQGYSVVWPDQESLTEDEQATIAVKRTEALAKYIAGNVEAIMEPVDFFTRVMGMSTEEAEEVIEKVMKEMAKEALTGRLDPEPVDPLELIEAKAKADAGQFGQAKGAKDDE